MVNSVRTPPQQCRIALRRACLLLMGLLVSVLTSSHAVTSANPRTVIFAIDVSESIPSTDSALAYLTNTAERSLTKPDQLALVVFGQQAAVEFPPASRIQTQPIESRIDRQATNLEEALKLSEEMVSEEATGRVVLISDGIATSGDVTRILPKLKSRGIAVDVLPVEYTYISEVWLDGLQLPASDRTGRSDEATVLLSALTDGFGTLIVGDNGSVVATQQVTYQAGTNQFVVPLPEAASGYHQYFANIEVDPALDKINQNNTTTSDLFVDGRRKVLLVTNGLGKRLDVPPLELAIRQAADQIEIINPQDLSPNVPHLASYDSIIFSDVHRDQFEAEQLRAVHDAVYERGVGFLMTGSSNSFGCGGYENTPIEALLPVSLGFQIGSRRRIAVAIAMDRLRTADGVTWSKRLTKTALRMLRPDDESCVLISEGRNGKVLCPLATGATDQQQAASINEATIDFIQSWDGIMEMGLKELQKSTAAARQMLIIADRHFGPPSPSLVQQFINARISVSIIAMHGPDGLRHSWMSSVAEVTGGRYYPVDDPYQITQILTQESRCLNQDQICRDRIFEPVVADKSEMIRDLGRLPSLSGYVLTRIKQPSVTRILNVPSEDKTSDSLDPLLAIWDFGIGKSAALMTDLDSVWGREWQQWDQFPQFVKQLLAGLSRSRYLWMSTRVTRDEALIVVHDVHPEESDLAIQLEVIGPDRKSVHLIPEQVCARTYQVRVPLWGHGRYRIVATTSRIGIQEFSCSGFTHAASYSAEYLQFRSNRQALLQIAAATGGTILTGDPTRDAVYSHVPRTFKQVPEASFDWFLMALALLVPLEAIARRIWIGAAESLAERRHFNPVSSSQTMEALFHTKEWVTAALSAKGTARMLIQIWSPPPIRSASVSPPMSTADQTANADPSSVSTIEKLLILKRQNNEHS